MNVPICPQDSCGYSYEYSCECSSEYSYESSYGHSCDQIEAEPRPQVPRGDSLRVVHPAAALARRLAKGDEERQADVDEEDRVDDAVEREDEPMERLERGYRPVRQEADLKRSDGGGPPHG